MVPIAELVTLFLVVAVGVRWYLRTSLHRARKASGVHPPQVAGHMGFGMYSRNDPPLLPHGLHGHNESETGPEPLPEALPGLGDA